MNEGYGSNSAPFEYTIEKQGKDVKKRKILLILLYIAWTVLFLSVGVIVKLILPLLCFIPLSLWILVWLTWRFTHEEIKVTLSAGTMVVTRLFDGKNAKNLAEVKIKDIECFEKYSEEKMQKCNRDNIIYATQNTNLEEAYIVIWGNITVVMETNEKALKIIKYYNTSLFEN